MPLVAEEIYSPNAVAPGRIMVVDDEGLMRNLLRDILVREGHQVTAVSGGRQAIDNIKRERFDIIVTDLKMPGAGGEDVLFAAKAVDPTYPVIVITGYPSSESKALVAQMGVSDYIIKPFSMDLLKTSVARLLEGSRQYPAY